MKYLYCFIFFILTAGVITAQKRNINGPVTHSHALHKKLLSPGAPNSTQAPGCDTINYPIPARWSVLYYSLEEDGFLTGTNAYGDLQKAGYFDLSATSNTYLTKVWIGFGAANSNKVANLSKTVTISVYGVGASGQPSTILGSASKLLSEIKSDVDSGKYTEVKFPTAVSLPASKKFFVSVDMSKLTWSTAGGFDSLVVYSNDVDETALNDNGFGWEQWDNGTWYTLGQGWGADFALIIHPFVSTNPNCSVQGPLPITLSNFSGENFQTYNTIRWSTASEQHYKGFEIQRSSDNVHFETLEFIGSKAVNGTSTTMLGYSYKDEKPLASVNYYRLKQIDINGVVTLSKTIIIKGTMPARLQLGALYPNPSTSEINLIVASPANDQLTLIVTDLTGRIVLKKAVNVISGNNNLPLNIASLVKGTYIIKAACNNGCENAVSRFVKQ